MVAWIFLFTAKFYLCFRGYLQLDAVWSVALLAYLAVLEVARLAREGRELPAFTRYLHAAVGAVFAFAVTWHDTYFPPLPTLVSFISDPVTRPSSSYLVEFIAGYWNPREAIALGAILAVSVLGARRKWHLGPPLGIALLVFLGVQFGRRPLEAGQIERDFYASERKEGNKVSFEKGREGAAPFDIVFLQICSLSWDDLNQVGLPKPPLFERFDFLFTRFNTVTSYSTPSALRLLRANCGQSRHEALYQPAPPECYLMDALRGAGYSTATVFNHAKKLSTKMAEETARFGKADPPMDVSDLRPEAINFDETPVFNNFEILERWWKARLSSGAPRAAVYYNTVSLHTGAHDVGDKEWWKRPNAEKYRKSLSRTLADLSRFFDLLEGSGRDVLVVLVPEHGAALVGSSIQAADLRDIPLPKITMVPLGVRFFTRERRLGRAPARIGKPVSYQSISRLIAGALHARNEGAREVLSVETASSLPEIPYFAENESAHTLIQGGKLLYRDSGESWKNLPSDLLVPADSSSP